MNFRFFYWSVCLSVGLSVGLSVYLSFGLSVIRSLSLSVCLVYLSVSVRLYVGLSLCSSTNLYFE